jgi:hypothetical protein
VPLRRCLYGRFAATAAGELRAKNGSRKRLLALLVLVLCVTSLSCSGSGEDDDTDPHPRLLTEASRTANSSRTVPAKARNDADRILDVASARFHAGSDPMVLVWNLKLPQTRATIPCFDCYYLAPHVRRFIAIALEQTWAVNLVGIDGYDAARRDPGEFAGNGWTATLLVESDENGYATTGRGGGVPVGNEIVRWLLDCTKNRCRSQRLGVTELLHANRRWSVPTCRDSLSTSTPHLIDRSYTEAVSSGASDDLRYANSATKQAAVVVALPRFSPRFSDDTPSEVSDYQSTDCPREPKS